jgi:exopolysaccharide biosynthesis polyprenyl glycosylphosphotransferase
MKQEISVPILDEPLFQRMLSLERRRCERTSASFALLLADFEALNTDPENLYRIARALGAVMRETDITGWYSHHSVIGIILTTLNGAERATLESVVLEKAKSVLTPRLQPAELAAVRIALHVFPQDMDDDLIGPMRTFYRDNETAGSKPKSHVFLKRMIDVFGSLAALIVLSPLFIVIAALVKLTSRGPIFFSQKRIGQYGRQFTFLKFRSMFVNNDAAIHQEYIRNLIANKVSGTYKIQNDPRVTRVGRFLRKTSMDELPQFINVLRGEMSLVGPRPPIPYEFEGYSLWHRRRVLQAKPGITGEWQVHGRSRTSFDEMVRMDLRYIQNQSIWLDLKILIKTPFAVLSGDGAY